MAFTLPKYTWDKDRLLCKQCKHYTEAIDPHVGTTIMICEFSPYRTPKRSGSCIDNRTRGPCGPEGRFFQKKSDKETSMT